MHPQLVLFLRQFTGVVLATLVPVVMVAFLSWPIIMGGHPGEPRDPAALSDAHFS
ncbi:conserved hypothetical protein [Rubrivivax sp. A210]|uniref:hypothetical protein n=1 Tax=Rubrivivax sp. A210 TaxID=2772301 RepID=UPI00191B204E|nr:hypothetical protein [Rubrivivax sp. A210]CAD5374354.1 conserved hypothetical protein [Rubrivivax sp. A210]